MQANPNAAAHGSSHAQRDTDLLRDELHQDSHMNAGTANSALAGNPAPGEDAAGKGRSHATGKSIVPETLQQKLPEKVERAVPNALHDTSGLPPRRK
ncbi:unnamed protein product [Peniophora sp. CBMAI 1063]|nr:unnamed protein product [Peniophora sp. CBMAI 1063]